MSMYQNDRLIESLTDCKAVFFDMDGTIVDSMWMWRNIDIEYLGRFGIPLPENLQKNIEGMSFSETAMYFKDHFGIEASVEEIKDTWNAMAMDKYRHEVPLKKGAGEFLQILKGKGYRLGIATSNSRELAMCCLDALGVSAYFDTIVTGCDVKAGKPSPDIYLRCAEDCQVLPGSCMVFEDITKGIEAGLRAGMKVCAVYDAYSEDTDHIKREMAHHYLTEYTHIVDAVKEIEEVA